MENNPFVTIDASGIGNRIKHLIYDAGFSVLYIASVLGVTPQTVYKWMNSPEALPDLQHLYDISVLFNVTIDWIVTGGKPP